MSNQTNDQHPSYHMLTTTSTTTVLRSPLEEAYHAASQATQEAWEGYERAQRTYETCLFAFPLPAPSPAAWRAHLADLAALQAVIDAAFTRYDACSKMEHALYLQVREWMRERGMWYGGNAG